MEEMVNNSIFGLYYREEIALLVIVPEEGSKGAIVV